MRDKSGTYANIMLIIDDEVWIVKKVNTGNSRAILLSNSGKSSHQFLTTTKFLKNQRGIEFSKLMDMFTKTITLCLQAQEDR